MGKWNCIDLPCPGRCSIEGGSFVTTFDSRQYRYHGVCTYLLVKSVKMPDNGTIEVVFEKSGVRYSETQLTSVIYATNQKKMVISNQDTVEVNNELKKLPYQDGNIVIYRQSSSYIQVESTFGLEMQIQVLPFLQLYVTVDERFATTTHGLCGNFDRVSLNDFNSSMGIEEGTAGSFVDSWRVIEHCQNARDKDCDPCSLSQPNSVYAHTHCSILLDKSSIFGKCHCIVDPTDYYERCKFETCNYEKSQDFMCTALSVYVRACAVKGLLLKGWRNVVSECKISCHVDQVFDYDSRACNHTCFSLSNPILQCSETRVPVDGCICPADTFLDDANMCVSASNCPCFLPDDLIISPGKSARHLDKICFCKNGKLDCSRVSLNLEEMCIPPKIYFDCSSDEYGAVHIPTCQMHATETSFLAASCVPGCVCPEGMMLNEKDQCVLPEDCPCEFSGMYYHPMESIVKECQRCICFRGKWECTGGAKCPSTCVIHGEGHVTTFDGKHYVFDGSCEYILVQDACSVDYKLPSFKIVSENIICGIKGVVCTKSIKIYLEDILIKLADGQYTLIPANAVRHFKVVSNPLYLKFDFVMKAKLELTVIWNKNMNVYISITRLYEFAVCGLCGNYNGKVDDEYIAQSKYLVSNLLVFANSWKEDATCTDVIEVATPCFRNPYRFASAEKMCAIINSKVFEPCHKLVYRMPYFDNCVRDACGCELVGNCECLCDAVAVYAKACIDAGVCIDWRTPDFCPVYCDYFNSRQLDSTMAEYAQNAKSKWRYLPCLCQANIHIFGKFNMEGCYICGKEEYFHEDLKRCVSCGEPHILSSPEQPPEYLPPAPAQYVSTEPTEHPAPSTAEPAEYSKHSKVRLHEHITPAEPAEYPKLSKATSVYLPSESIKYPTSSTGEPYIRKHPAGCTLNSKAVTLRKDGCQVNVVSHYCKGQCISETRYNGEVGVTETHCSCCSPKKFTEMTTYANCPSGSTVPIKYTLFQECECVYRSCEKVHQRDNPSLAGNMNE